MESITQDTIYALTIQNGYAYLGIEDSLAIVDVTVPAESELINSYQLNDRVVAFSHSGEYAFTIREKYVIDISDAYCPVIVGRYTTEDEFGRPQEILNGNLALISDGINGLRVTNIYDSLEEGSYRPQVPGSLHFSPQPIWVPSYPHAVLDVVVSDRYAYVAESNQSGEGEGHITVLDISSPSVLRAVGSYELPRAPATQVRIRGDYAFASSSGLLLSEAPAVTVILDVSNPAEPIEVGELPVRNLAALTDTYAYFVDITGLRIWDISNLADPEEIGFLSLPGSLNAPDAGIVGEVLYLAYRGVLHIIDVSNPSAPFALER